MHITSSFRRCAGGCPASAATPESSASGRGARRVRVGVLTCALTSLAASLAAANAIMDASVTWYRRLASRTCCWPHMLLGSHSARQPGAAVASRSVATRSVGQVVVAPTSPIGIKTFTVRETRPALVRHHAARTRGSCCRPMQSSRATRSCEQQLPHFA